jgi:c-di-GMP-binding flagellar brake protein YcgR
VPPQVRGGRQGPGEDLHSQPEQVPSRFFKVFESDAGQFLQAIAEVVRVDEVVPFTSYHLGVRFLDIDHDDWNALRNFIAKAQ